MKTAIYIEDGVLQLVITPESEHEKAAVKLFEGKEPTVRIFSGSFYACQGGWTRNDLHSRDTSDRSLILRMETKQT